MLHRIWIYHYSFTNFGTNHENMYIYSRLISITLWLSCKVWILIQKQSRCSGEFSGMASIVPPYNWNGSSDVLSLLKILVKFFFLKNYCVLYIMCVVNAKRVGTLRISCCARVCERESVCEGEREKQK